MLRVKVDEDLPTAITQMVEAAGYVAAGVREQGMGGWKDPPLWQAIQARVPAGWLELNRKAFEMGMKQVRRGAEG